MLIITLLTLALYFHCVFANTPSTPAFSTLMENTNCSTEASAEYDRCSQKALATITSDDMCANVRKMLHCLPPRKGHPRKRARRLGSAPVPSPCASPL
jgi:hypothetical protein